MKARARMLIVDGYNVLRSGSRYQRILGPDYTDDTFNAARERLINDVAVYAGRMWEAVIVFDGGGNDFSDGSEQTFGGVRVVFSPAGQSADKVIEKLAPEARKRLVEPLVVASAAAVPDTVFGGGVARMSAEGFSREMASYYHEAHLDESPRVARKNTVADRIDAATLAKLEALRDGTDV